MNQDDIGIKDIYDILLELKQGFGRVESSVANQQTTLASHIEDDKRLTAQIVMLQTQHAEADRQMERRISNENIAPLSAEIEKLKISAAKQAGAARAWGLIGAGVATAAGIAASFFRGH